MFVGIEYRRMKTYTKGSEFEQRTKGPLLCNHPLLKPNDGYKGDVAAILHGPIVGLVAPVDLLVGELRCSRSSAASPIAVIEIRRSAQLYFDVSPSSFKIPRWKGVVYGELDSWNDEIRTRPRARSVFIFELVDSHRSHLTYARKSDALAAKSSAPSPSPSPIEKESGNATP